MQNQTLVISLRCASCGASLSIGPDMDQFACGYCGATQIVERSGGTVSLKIIEQAISRVQIGTDKTAAELALKRLDQELQQIASEQLFIINLAEQKVQKLISRGLLACALMIVIAIAIGNGTESTILGIIAGLLGVGSVIYVGNKVDDEISSERERTLAPILKKRAAIEGRIANNKAIVDS